MPHFSSIVSSKHNTKTSPLAAQQEGMLDNTIDVLESSSDSEGDEQDEQDVMDNRRKSIDKQGDAGLLLKIRAKHMQLVSRSWIIASIVVQLIILLLAFGVFYQATLYHFTDGSGNLTPIYFWPLTSGETFNDFSFDHSGKRFWWFHFNNEAECAEGNIHTATTCATLIGVRWSNSFLVAGLLLAYIFTIISTIMLFMMFCQKYFRFTNCVLFIPALSNLTVPIIWYFVSDSRAATTQVKWSTIGLIEIFGVLELLCYLGGRYYTSKLYKADFKQMLLDDMSSSDEEESDEEGSSKRTSSHIMSSVGHNSI